MLAIMMTRHSLKAYQICSELEYKFSPTSGFLLYALNPVARDSHIWNTIWV